MQKLKATKLLPVLMALTITAIIAFQIYWLQKAYDREKRNVEMRANLLFRESVRSVQASKLKLDRVVNETARTPTLAKEHIARTDKKKIPNQKIEGMVDVLLQKIKDSGQKQVVVSNNKIVDTQFVFNKGFSARRNRLIQFLFDLDSLQDSVKVRELDISFAKHLNEQNLTIPFNISRVPTRPTDEPVFNEITLGFSNPITYRLDLGNMFPFLLKRISVPILFSLFLVAFTILSFFLLYKNLLKQNRLANIKNEFISNITHELKTPIATVSVAIEALRSFNDQMNPEKTKEYLDISANELQRLSLLVDKVLKLSMFENREVELKYELLDSRELVEEVTSSMRLQFEKHKAELNITTEGNTTLEGDRLHLVSVLFNLFDNALKYSTGKPKIDIHLKGNAQDISLKIKDSGIGIPAEYQSKIFEKFFRVPTGNLHNAKGYGLGLSYVAHVIKRHHGNIRVESVEGDGCRFIINLPKYRAA